MRLNTCILLLHPLQTAAWLESFQCCPTGVFDAGLLHATCLLLRFVLLGVPFLHVKVYMAAVRNLCLFAGLDLDDCIRAISLIWLDKCHIRKREDMPFTVVFSQSSYESSTLRIRVSVSKSQPDARLDNRNGLWLLSSQGSFLLCKYSCSPRQLLGKSPWRT